MVHIVHFNDVYNIEAASREPVGGAAKFVSKVGDALLQQVPLTRQQAPLLGSTCNQSHHVPRLLPQVRSLSHLNPLVLFSGDCFNPSLMSTITLGKQMVPILNMVNVKVGHEHTPLHCKQLTCSRTVKSAQVSRQQQMACLAAGGAFAGGVRGQPRLGHGLGQLPAAGGPVQVPLAAEQCAGQRDT